MLVVEREHRRIYKMPDKKTLEAYLDCMSGATESGVHVSFNVYSGVFDNLGIEIRETNHQITRMPDKQILEDFLNNRVLFNSETGRFESK